MMTIVLEDMEFYAFHGCMPEEKSVGTIFRVTVEIFCDIPQAVYSDNLQHTIDYQRVYQLVAQQMRIPSNLIEHVAHRIKKSILDEYTTLKDVRVRVSKLHPPVGGQMSAVSCVL